MTFDKIQSFSVQNKWNFGLNKILKFQKSTVFEMWNFPPLCLTLTPRFCVEFCQMMQMLESPQKIILVQKIFTFFGA